MFQGDTLSPVIFLFSFNPVIELANRLSTSGFSLRIPIPNSTGLPPLNSAIYVFWDEISDEPRSWYYALVKEHLSDGTSIIEYSNNATETINLHSVKWKLTTKAQKPYLPQNLKPPSFPLKKVRDKTLKPKFVASSDHSAKAFADDLSVFSSSPQDHQSLLSSIDNSCSDLGLTLKPEKCVSIVFNGFKMDHSTTFSLKKGGSTQNITDVPPAKLLGKLIAFSMNKTKKFTSSELEKNVLIVLERINLFNSW